MFLGINMFLALLRLILTLATLGLKWFWVRPKTYLLYAREHQLCCYIAGFQREMMGVIILNLLLLKFSASIVAVSQSRSHESSFQMLLRNRKNNT